MQTNESIERVVVPEIGFKLGKRPGITQPHCDPVALTSTCSYDRFAPHYAYSEANLLRSRRQTLAPVAARPRHQRDPGHSAGGVFCRNRISWLFRSGRDLPDVKKPYHAVKEPQKRKTVRGSNQHPATKPRLTPVVLNSLEGIRGAFYVQWDAASFASLKEYYPQIDLLFPEWLHTLTADGRLQSSPKPMRCST